MVMLTLGVLLTALAAGPDDAAGPKTLFRPEMFETLVNPDCSHCVDEARKKAGVLRADDRVLAWIRGEYSGGAIPYRWFLVPYRVISDSYGVFVYDADADFVRGWPASYDFGFHGWRNGVMVMRHKDGTPLPAERTIAVLQAWGTPGPAVGPLLKRVEPRSRGWVLMLDPIEQSWEPRAAAMPRERQ